MTRKHDLMPSFPIARLRRTRMKTFSRAMTQEHHLTAADFIWPVFVTEGDKLAEAIEGLDGVKRYSLDQLADQAKEALALGIPAMAIFPGLRPPSKMKTAPMPLLAIIWFAVLLRRSNLPPLRWGLWWISLLIPLPPMVMTG